MKGVGSVLGFVLFFALLAGVLYITNLLFFYYITTLNQAQKEIVFYNIKKLSIGYSGYCDESNFLRVYYSGGVPEYAMRLVCVDYNADSVGNNNVCLLPRKGSSATVVDVVYPATNPLQNPIEYNILACEPSDTWLEDCKYGRIVCFALGKLRAYPFTPVKQV